ncbi:DUF1667 domain-containing protein [Caldisalinibacter kiritimatiensis]|uniref:DUF1667 domain-containing protein n=1 Tax=Caldisalinibacter kiritimatiensis TaxID=1304284 RepID=R1CSG6_9FIRM|nr:DUF1667 domain-containing protein [Caldisalinibacter kiritimatiensis]EOC99648.1 hypothetical protein L21TH_2291 [Caldisalinibacter kiritimatiensis]
MNEAKTLTCIVCPIGCTIDIKKENNGFMINGNKCKRGEKYAIEELTAPKRIVTTTVKVNNSVHPVVSVKTSEPVPKEKIFDIMEVISNTEVTAPVKIGDIIVKDILDTGVDIVATRNAKEI